MKIKFSNKLPESVGWWLAKDDDDIFATDIYELNGTLVSDDINRNFTGTPVRESEYLKWAGPIEFE